MYAYQQLQVQISESNSLGILYSMIVIPSYRWKFGQLRPGDVIKLTRISYDDAMRLQEHTSQWIETVLALSSGFNASPLRLLDFTPSSDVFSKDPKLHTMPATDVKPKVVLRQVRTLCHAFRATSY